MVFKCSNISAYKYKVVTLWKILGDNYSEFIHFLLADGTQYTFK